MEPEKISVGWIDPGQPYGQFTHSIAHTLSDMQYHGCAGRVFRHSSSIPILARNQLVREFLDEDDSPWLWLVDADMVFDKGHPMKLWEAASEHDVKMVSGLAFIYGYGDKPVPSFFYEEDGEMKHPHNYVPDEPMLVTATGLASSLIHREVFEAMQAERFEAYRWFDIHRSNAKGEALGEDLQFYVRAAELGYQLLLEPRAQTWHIKQIGIGMDEWRRAWGEAVVS